MPPRQTIGIPTLRVSQYVPDPQVRRALEEVAQEATRWLQRLAEGIDETTGLRGEPTFHAAVNAKDNRLMKVGVPQEETDAQVKGLSLGRVSFNDKAWDARGMPIVNLPKELSPAQADASMSQEQIRALIKEMIRTELDLLVTTGTFTMTGTGFTAVITGTARWIKIQDCVLLFLPGLTGTSNATTFTLTGMPADITPTQTSNHVVTVTDTSTDIYALLRLTASSATITMLSALQANGDWGNSGTKALFATMIAYHLA